MTTPRRPAEGRRRAGADEPVSVLDTTEIRWFVPGPLPADVRGWFTGTTGIVEERRDTYLLDDRVDVGVKYRGGAVLELKVRERLGRRADLGDGLVGPLEMWRKWAPADGRVEIPTSACWIDVDKVVVKRRFSLDGTEVPFSPDQYAAPGCDVEVADVTVGSIVAWSLAFAAFGPPVGHRPALLASRRTVSAGAPDAVGVALHAARAMGYPEWLAHTFRGEPRYCAAALCSRERIGT